MGGKKKKKKKKTKKLQSQLQDRTLGQLLQSGTAHLENDNPREAISVLRFAEKRHGKSDDISALLARSYLIRSAQLSEKGLHSEADTTITMCRNYIKDFASFSETDIQTYVVLSPEQEAFQAYKRYINGNSRSPVVEQCLAGRLFESGDWRLAEMLDSDLPMSREAAVVREAVPLMDDGEWESALEKLRPLSRKSAFAPVRLFCRAMAAFYNGKDNDAIRALTLIPKQFPLSGVANGLKTILAEQNGSKAKASALSNLGLLWDGPVNPEEMIDRITKTVEKKQWKKAAKAIGDFTETVFPSVPVPAKSMILQIITDRLFKNHGDTNQIGDLIRQTLPAKKAHLLISRLNLMQPFYPFTNTGMYISDYLETDFPNPEDRKVARALILLTKAGQIKTAGAELVYTDIRGLAGYGGLLGMDPDISRGEIDVHAILISMTVESIRLDPGNRKAFEFLVGIPRSSRKMRKKVETALVKMHYEFPDDPFPCLELATVYYENHAFRKAETVLGDAMERAPHDNRVLERHAISLLVSAEINIRRGKFHLVEKDIDRAEQLDVRNTALYVREKKILAQLIRSGGNFNIADKAQLPIFEDGINLNGLMDEMTEDLSLFEQIRILSLLALDIKGQKIKGAKTLATFLDKQLKRRLKKPELLSSSEIIDLLTRPPKNYQPVFNDRDVAAVLLNKSKKLLNRIDTSDIIPVYDRILFPALYDVILKDIRKRIKPASERDRLLLRFYALALEFIDGREDDPDLFYDIICDADEGPWMEDLRTMARRLAPFASGPLKTALEQFDFDLLDVDTFGGLPFFGGFPFDEDDDDDFWDDDDFLGEEDGFDFPKGIDFPVGEGMSPAFVVSMIEEMIDDLDLRGAPDVVIKIARNMGATPHHKMVIELSADMIANMGAKNKLSREARVFLFGTRKDT